MRCTVAIVMVLMFFCTGIVLSHAPAKVDLKFEKETQLLHVAFEHKVNDARQHFVYRVKVRLNKKDLIEQALEMQDGKDGGSLVYKINNAKAGDNIEVRIDCVKGGSKTGKLDLE